MTGRQREAAKVTHIGILLAGEYGPRPDFFGLMFDEAFVPGSSDPGELTPREGCAVFLGAIDRKRQGDGFIQEVQFTGTHELGHVFNQQHSNPRSFMAVSADRMSPFDVGSCAFNKREQSLLGQCSTSRFIWPGGSAFGDLGDLATNAAVDGAAANSGTGLTLTIGTDRDAFWPFEPMELDVTISCSRATRSRDVPDMIDPGYDAFTIWIEEPSGERRRYRSPKHYCRHKSKVRISHDKPFRRDISIFGESGAFTFRRVGVHRVWAQFQVSPSNVLHSNLIELNVLAPTIRDSYKAAKQVFHRHDIAQLLYYRRLTAERLSAISSLDTFVSAFPRARSNATAHYAIGRSLEDWASSRTTRSDTPPREIVEAARHHLRRAVRSTTLGDHRRERAEHALLRLGFAR